MKASDGGEVYSPSVGGKRFLKNKFFSLGRLSPWTVSDGGEVYSPNVGGTSFNCTFLPRAEKEQDNYAEGIIIFKRIAPEGANLRFAPSGLPHSRGMA